jgi:hypothetical protein
MQQELINIQDAIIGQIKKMDAQEWATIEVHIDFPPFINRGWKGAIIIKNSKGDNITGTPINIFDLSDDTASFIFKYNQDNLYNQILFSAKKDEMHNTSIKAVYNQQVEDDFRNNLPKSWRKKTWLPWWKNPEETKGLG